MRKEDDMKEEKIIHIMADGTRRESIEGLVVPVDHAVYGIILGMNEKRMTQEKQTAS